MRHEIFLNKIFLLLMFNVFVFNLRSYCQILLSDSCTFDSTNNRANLGLYGGYCNDLSYSVINNRLFAATESPLGLFYSDDSANSWIPAYSVDSLFFECGERGCGGSCKKVITNKKGWVVAYTNTSVTASFNNGDTGSWKTIIDTWMLQQLGYSTYSVTGLGITDYKIFVLMGPLIVIADSKGIDTIIDLSNSISGVDSNHKAISIAAANDSVQPWFCVVVDTFTTTIGMNMQGVLYLYDNFNFNILYLPSDYIQGIASVFGNSDTIFISGSINTNGNINTYKSFDLGSTWTSIDHAYKDKSHLLTDVDFSSEWNSLYPQSGGIMLICDAQYVSKELGASWDSIQIINHSTPAFAIHPQNFNQQLISYPCGIKISKNGYIGPFQYSNNKELLAINVNQISKTKYKGEFYIATSAGVGYTTAYLNDAVLPIDKWKPPYGEFPLSIGQDISISSIAINPFDSLNIVLGTAGQFNTSTTCHLGFNGFSSFYNGPSYFVNDIIFFDTSTVIAITGDQPINNGQIFLSTNKGISWSDVTPSGFTCGNSITVRDTSIINKSIYIGCGSSINGNADGALWKSIDSGTTWTKVNDGPTSSLNSSITNMTIYAIAIDPRSNDTLYIGAASSKNTYPEFFKSIDGGITYIPINVQNLFREVPSSILTRKDKPDSFLLAFGATLSMYDAINDTSFVFFRGVPYEQIPELEQGSILVGTTTGFYTIYEPDDDYVQTNAKSDNNILGVKIYPNPAKDILHIDLQNMIIQNCNIAIHDMLGRTLIHNNFSTNIDNNDIKINLEKFHPGIYLISIETNDSKLNYLISVIK